MKPGAKLLVIVPARGGSKGVPRKNVRLLHGMPLIGHVLTAVRDSRFSPSVWVSTDDEEIGDIAERYGARVLWRPAALAGDAVTLDPVIHHATLKIEELSGITFDAVATVQPTSPLLTRDRFDAVIGALDDLNYDSVITVVEDRHLRWSGSPDAAAPEYKERVNRQQLPPLYRETGAVLATQRRFVTADGRFGPRVRLVPLAEQEAVDIDSNADWWLAENYLDRRRIAIRVDGGGAIGLGHVYRIITLSSRLFNHELLLFMDPAFADGIRLAEHFGLRVARTTDPEFARDVAAFQPDVVILDVLDTSRDFVNEVRVACDFIVTFEDLGEGADVADLVFNEMYDDPKADGERRFTGPSVSCLREEFYSITPRPTADLVTEVLVTFGGTDPNNLTAKALNALDMIEGTFKVTVVLGLGYPDAAAVEVQATAMHHDVRIFQNVRNISTLMARADIALTSAGRTVFELIASQTPVIALAQNERELLHTCIDEAYGVSCLGLGADLPLLSIAEAVRNMLPYEMRSAVRERMAAVDLWHGPEKILGTILHGIRARQLKMRLLTAQHGGRNDDES